MFDQPLLCLRYDESMSDELWEEAVAVVQTGTGFPAFFSDKACIAAKEKMGHSPEDAHDYAMIGCVEMTCPGKEYAKTEVLRVNWPKVLELMLNDGKSSMSEDIIKPYTSRDLNSIQSFEEFYDWYKDELLKHTAFAMESINRLDPMVPERFPTPYMSILMEGCIQKGKDVTGGGTKYNNSGISACGMANAVDSLAVIRKLVFEDKKYTLQEIADAAFVDFQGYEDMLVDINHCPNFGNDDDSVDWMMSDLIDAYGKLVDSTTNPRGGRFQLGLYSVEDHAKMGQLTGGLPSGRLSGTAFANAMAPVQGKDKIGPTAVVNSVVKSDLSTATNGMVLDMKFNPTFFQVESHKAALRALINSFFRQGGMEMQFNVVDRATLRDAQAHPEKHWNLVVRVSGFSAYFRSLMKTTQDEIIARTEYTSM
jgi:formate C-acetyltransferase